MLRIGLISDTHGLLRPEATAFLAGSDHIVHAGDVGDPAILDALAAVAPLTAIRGNVDVDGPMGTIFGVYRRATERIGLPASDEDFLRPGRDLVAAGYILYGPSTMFVYSAGDAVSGFTLDRSIGTFFLTRRIHASRYEGRLRPTTGFFLSLISFSRPSSVNPDRAGGRMSQVRQARLSIGSLRRDFSEATMPS